MSRWAAAIVLSLSLACVGRASTSDSTLSAAAAVPKYLFDKGRKHGSISVTGEGRVAVKDSGEDYQTVLLRPPASRTDRSYVEMCIEKQAERQCFMAFGVCEGNHDFEGNTCPDSDEEGVEGDGGRSALASKTAWMLSTHSGKSHQNGGESKPYLPGKGTPPFYPADEDLALTSVRPREGDKVGLLLDRGEGTLSVYVNGIGHGVMSRDIPGDRDIFFAADLSDAGQKISISDSVEPSPQDETLAGEMGSSRNLGLRGGFSEEYGLDSNRLRGGFFGSSSQDLTVDPADTERLLTDVLGVRDMTSNEIWSIRSLLTPRKDEEMVPVVVTIPSPEQAEADDDISIVGSWSGWLSIHRMKLADDGEWKTTILVPKGSKRHTFKILSKGMWFLTGAYDSEPDELGSPGNNVLEIDPNQKVDHNMVKRLKKREEVALAKALDALEELAVRKGVKEVKETGSVQVGRQDSEVHKRVKEEKMRRLAEEKAEKKAEEERIAAEKAAEEMEKRVAAEKKKAEEERIAAEKKKAEEERIAAEKKKAEEERIAAEKKKAEDQRIAAEKKAEEDRIAAEKKAEEDRIAAEKKAEEERIAAEKKKAEEERIAAEKAAAEKKAEEERIAAAEKLQKAEEERVLAEQKLQKAEEERVAEISQQIARQAEEERKAVEESAANTPPRTEPLARSGSPHAPPPQQVNNDGNADVGGDQVEHQAASAYGAGDAATTDGDKVADAESDDVATASRGNFVERASGSSPGGKKGGIKFTILKAVTAAIAAGAVVCWQQDFDFEKINALAAAGLSEAVRLGIAAGGAVGDVAGEIGDGALHAAKHVGGAVSQGAQHVGTVVGQGAQHVGAAVGQGVRTVGPVVGEAALQVGGAVGQGAQHVGGLVGQGAQHVGGLVGEGAQHVGKSVGRGAKQAGGAIGRGAKRVGAGAVRFAKTIPDKSVRATRKVTSTVKSKLNSNSPGGRQNGGRQK